MDWSGHLRDKGRPALHAQDRRRQGDRHLPWPQLRHPEDHHLGRGHRDRRRHAERPRTGGGQLSPRPHDPLPDRPRRPPDRGHLAVLLSRLVLAWRPGGHERPGGRRHGAVGHQGQGRRPAGLPAARRRLPGGRHRLWPRQRRDHRGHHRRGGEVQGPRLQGDSPADRRAGPGQHLRGVGRQDVLRARGRRSADRERLVDGQVPQSRAQAVREGARGARRRRPPAARRPSPPHADRGRGAWARTWNPIACSGSRTPSPPRIRPASA
jgi:hypothetical protein